MLEWNRKVLEREGERMRGIEEEAERRKVEGENDGGVEGEQAEEDEQDESKIAKDLNSKGGHIIVNDEGEVMDKRQLLSAGLNSAPRKPASATTKAKSTDAAKPQEYHRSSQARNAREAQRERQSRMMERQIEEMTAAEQKSKEEEEKVQEEKSKSRITDGEKMSARERYLQRKKEREEEAKKGKGG